MRQVQNKLENEISILRGLIARYTQERGSESICIIMAYEYGLQALTEVYQLSKQKEEMPF
ncbi:TPA: hypothetical protein ACQUHP_006588 [Bacillus cereus]